jgi:predicted RNase H-like HicB family nuclease
LTGGGWQRVFVVCSAAPELPIVVESDKDGDFVPCPALQGCYSQGETYEDAVANIKDAIRLHVADRVADGEKFPNRSP